MEGDEQECKRTLSVTEGDEHECKRTLSVRKGMNMNAKGLCLYGRG